MKNYKDIFIIFCIFALLRLLIDVNIMKKELKKYQEQNKEIIENLQFDLEYKCQDFYKMSPDTGLWYVMDYLNVLYPNIVYSQAILETGYFNSKLCKEYNNLFGLYDSKKKDYYKFNHWSESVLAYKLYIQDKYDYINNNNEESYYKFLSDLPYATDPNYIKKLKKLTKNN